jgi:hypothetical protein
MREEVLLPTLRLLVDARTILDFGAALDFLACFDLESKFLFLANCDCRAVGVLDVDFEGFGKGWEEEVPIVLGSTVFLIFLLAWYIPCAAAAASPNGPVTGAFGTTGRTGIHSNAAQAIFIPTLNNYSYRVGNCECEVEGKLKSDKSTYTQGGKE